MISSYAAICALGGMARRMSSLPAWTMTSSLFSPISSSTSTRAASASARFATGAGCYGPTGILSMSPSWRAASGRCACCQNGRPSPPMPSITSGCRRSRCRCMTLRADGPAKRAASTPSSSKSATSATTATSPIMASILTCSAKQSPCFSASPTSAATP